MRKEVEQLALMGAMPDETDEPTDVLIDKYADEKKAQRTAPAQTKHKQQDMEL